MHTVTLSAVALAKHPEWRLAFRRGETRDLVVFTHEVRRYYPFFPMIGGIATRDFGLNGYALPAGSRVVLDLYGTNHDSRLWPEPDTFDPGRFVEAPPHPHEFVPQGGGEYASGHRCPGETVTTAVLARMTELLAQADFEVPEQDLTYPLSHFPTLPNSGLVFVT